MKKSYLNFFKISLKMLLTLKKEDHMNTNPKISIIVPIYNIENYIKYCLDSLMLQTLKRIEIICIDDGSTDRSGAICDEYAEKYNIKAKHDRGNGSVDDR